MVLFRYVSRVSPRDNTRHVILSTASMRPMDFAGQLNVSLANGWGIVRTVTDLCMKMPDGKYVLIKDTIHFIGICLWQGAHTKKV